MKLVLSLLVVAAISCCGAQLKTNEELNDQFKKMKRVLNKGNKKMKKIEAKILANNANGVVSLIKSFIYYLNSKKFRFC